jgi:hypothetical protein
MSNSIRHDFHSDVATIISDDIQYQHSKYYYYLGKVEPWGIYDISPSIMQPDSDLENNTIRSNIVYIKSISPNDVSLVINRYNWESGIVFDSWDHTKNMEPLKFYCVTEDNNVYKCLDNNGGIASTSKPTGNSFYTTSTADGYTWKYMYNIPAFKRIRFSSLNYIPVQRSLTDSFYNKGSIDDVVVTNSGSGYNNNQVTTLIITGATTGSGAAGTLTVGPTGNIIGVNITNGGSGYTAGVNIAFTTSAGVNGKGSAIISAGIVTGMSIVAPGVGYVNGDVINFTVGGASVFPMVSRVTGSVNTVKILSEGAGYISPPSITISTTGPTGTGKYGNSTALFTSTIYQGKLVGVNIIDPGVLYSTDITTTISVQGDGTGAEFSPVIMNGEIVGVIVENPGTGYTTIKLNVIGDGTDANLTPLLSTSDFISDQSIVEQTTIPGAIYSVKIVEEGNNYSSNTVVTISGDGTGATGIAHITDGKIKKIQITNHGTDYTYANVVVTDSSRNVYGNNIDVFAYVTLPPAGGHGINAVSELFGSTLSINSSLRQETSLSNLYQDYRQFGILKNPTNQSNKKFLSTSSLIAYEVEFSSVLGLVKDEILILNNIKFRVISSIGNIVTLQQLGIKYIDPIGVFVADSENTRQYNSINVIKYPEVNKYSGKLIYSSNESPFSFSEEQGIIIKTFLKF